MQRISDIMTPGVVSVGPHETLRRAAQLMDALNVGALPVCENDRLIGMITDRDITVRATAAGLGPDDAQVRDAMSIEVRWCYENQEVGEVMAQMSDARIRRIPVLDHDSRKLIGIVSLGDMAAKHSAGVDHALENISTPAIPDRPGSTA